MDKLQSGVRDGEGVDSTLETEKRQQQLLRELQARPHMRISELAEQFNVSDETIRQDLEGMSQAGLVPRQDEGRVPVTGVFRLYSDLDARSASRKEERERIGRRAAGLVQPGSILMMDGGTTTLQMARQLAIAGTPCTVLTNSLPVAMTLGQSSSIDVVLCPGDYLAAEAAVSGAEALAFLDRHTVDACFIGASGIDSNGVSEAIRTLAIIKSAMIASARSRYVLAGREKLGHRDHVHVAELGDFNGLVCDEDPDPEFGEIFNAAGLSVYAGSAPVQRGPGG
ncbi:DeoR/GlpR family DNA-binding transcription regulator [Roseibium suaedae]|uniref:Transcriptional regulator, DeoR family n=1 Tax=Roseibium suaedae TaxID=735517 RepID=A0A1M7KPJ1_9HYPH|nr:DeoR/GlpR family DNA-binding transcription regulator [Roseibium suaedae]SHM67413.1 transcriptional regulator, DeoR family [Roseibium suaedae]